MTFFSRESWNGRGYIDGWIQLENQADVKSPSTGEVIAQVSMAGEADVAKAVELAVVAQREWAARSPEDRATIMRRAAELLGQHVDILAEWLISEAGSAQGKAAFEASLVAGELHHAAATARMPYGQLLTSSDPRLSMARNRPVGVVGVISPFNFPAILAARSIFPALALGNAVVLKPDPRTSISGGLFMAALLEEAGMPGGVFSVLPGGAEAGGALVDHPNVPVISFTGSTPAGRAIGERAARHLKRAHLELGGNNALVVMPDVDVAAAASAGAWGSFLHQGQICMTAGRHIVHTDIYDEYVALLAEKARAITAADPATGSALGPIIDMNQRDRVHGLVTSTVDAGAKLLAGGTYTDLFYQPTVLADVKADHPGFANEIFGPVAPVLRYETLDEAADIVNASEFGLSVGVLSRDAFAALEFGNRLNTGILHINDQTVADEPQAPFGGVGASGTGVRFGGHQANIEAFTETQWVTVRSQIPAYPF